MSDKGRPRSFDRADALMRAMKVFWEKGYEGAPLTALTAAMGINAPSLYAAFGCKEALYLEAMELYAQTVGTEIWAALEIAPTAREAVSQFLLATAEAYSQPDTPHGCLIALGGLHQAAIPEAVCEALTRHRKENIDKLRQRLEAAVAGGELPDGVDAGAVATFYATVQHGMSILARDGGSYEALKDVADGAMAAWGVMTQDPAP
ncbi:TetR/AcrR family transcriptional regulator [Sinorhizobium meliloti]|uniref:TetR/AcrR family transcriptional regulator n=1 Tax=Rhizobium meliloti TaxID=382 RepID=UPI001297B5F6|nr:TetR/AcrR family transcriptional regulator [Sinorhizobium meliloti]MQW54892.1 TetR family transcriptional regulator [Sinorhizobium meliloti]MQX91736.1 TetR family transcriptional regulator [Sinorhizobium meliloti]